ncbi:MAG: alpha/beta hydrolase-fold protein [Polyangiaceae bacterium]
MRPRIFVLGTSAMWVALAPMIACSGGSGDAADAGTEDGSMVPTGDAAEGADARGPDASAPDAPGIDAGDATMDAVPDVRADASVDSGTDVSSDASTDANVADVDPRPYRPPFQATIGGQAAWVHDERWASGYFNTFDALAVGGTPRKVHVYLPRDYEVSTARYPVAYFQDGDTTFWNGGAANKTWALGSVLDDLYARGAIVPIIVVAIHPLDRDREYTHLEAAPGRTCCGLAAYTTYVVDQVKPFVDGAYRTQAGPATTATVGSSHGGLAAFWIATRRPEAFGKAIAMSSSFWVGLDGVFDGGPLADAVLVKDVAGTLGNVAVAPVHPTMWLDWGLVRTGGFHNAWIEDHATTRGREMAALLRGSYGFVSGTTLFTDEDPAGGHDEDSWHRRIGPALAAMFPR